MTASRIMTATGIKANDHAAGWPEAAVDPAAPHTPCFTHGTLVATDKGAVAIEDLCVGDRVLTRDNGYRPLRWIGARRFDAAALARHPQLQPVRIRAGALGQGMPARDMLVSPQHQMLIFGILARAWGNEPEMLAPAIALAFLPGVNRDPQAAVTYVHLMFDAHEVILADGCWSESFLPAAATLGGMHAAQRAEILTIFPELASERGRAGFVPARGGLPDAARLAQAA